MRILLVEDSERVADTVRSSLHALGHSVVVAGGVRAADEAFAGQHFDVAIVDIGLPDGSGLDWCRSARREGSAVPILVLTARSGVADRVQGLDAGVDDYLGKPFSVEELAARLRALARRGPHFKEAVRWFGDVMIDRERRILAVGDARVPLTVREFDVVALLAWQGGRVALRDYVLETLWGDASEGAGASLDVLLARIRRKLADAGIREAVKTVRNTGYAWALELSKHD